MTGNPALIVERTCLRWRVPVTSLSTKESTWVEGWWPRLELAVVAAVVALGGLSWISEQYAVGPHSRLI
jgi:hypothetical protein